MPALEVGDNLTVSDDGSKYTIDREADAPKPEIDDGDFVEGDSLLKACKAALWYYESFRDSSPVGDTEKDDIAWIKSVIEQCEHDAKGGA